MMAPLPTGDFSWVEDVNSIDLASLDVEGPVGYFMEVDLEYPEHLHELHSDFPLAPEKMCVKKEWLSPYSLELLSRLGKRHMGSVPKLVPNLFNKTRYVVHSRILKQYVSLGLVITKVHRVLKFAQRPWMKAYIDYSTQKRMVATTAFEKDLWKLLNNAVFGKTMEDPRKHRQVELVNDDHIFRKRVAKATFHSFRIFDENLVAVEYKKQTIKLNKPIFVGAAILDVSKTYMYEFHYSYMKTKYGDKALLQLMDTDSLNYLVFTEDLYHDMGQDHHRFDFSDYPANHPLYSVANKKVPGKMKDETPNGVIQEQVGLSAKCYSSKNTGGFKQTAKGVSKAAQRELTHKHYRSCLLMRIPVFANQHRLQSNLHQMYAVCQNKMALSAMDDKRYILSDAIHTLAHGHYRIPLIESEEVDWDHEVDE